MKELMGGLWFAGLLAWAILGFLPGLVLIGLGAAVAAGVLAKERQAQQQAASWRKNYPPYRY